jgi:hypothetical protein
MWLTTGGSDDENVEDDNIFKENVHGEKVDKGAEVDIEAEVH